jgi:phage shock protein E
MYLPDIPNAREGTVIDVRTREEYDLGHVPGAVNIPWDLHLYYLAELSELPKPLILCCEEGWRAGLVVFSLRTLGFEEVYNSGRWIDIYREQAEWTEPMDEAA